MYLTFPASKFPPCAVVSSPGRRWRKPRKIYCSGDDPNKNLFQLISLCVYLYSEYQPFHVTAKIESACVGILVTAALSLETKRGSSAHRSALDLVLLGERRKSSYRLNTRPRHHHHHHHSGDGDGGGGDRSDSCGHTRSEQPPWAQFSHSLHKISAQN